MGVLKKTKNFRKELRQSITEINLIKLSEHEKTKLIPSLADLDENLVFLNDSKQEIEDTLLDNNKKLSHTRQYIRDIRKHGEKNPFGFEELVNKEDVFTLDEFYNIAGKNKTKHYRDFICDVILDASRVHPPFILNDVFIINDVEKDQALASSFCKVVALIESTYKLVDKHDECLEVMFTGWLIKYSTVFNRIKRSDYWLASSAFEIILEYKGVLCYIGTGTACFRNCKEFVFKRDFAND